MKILSTIRFVVGCLLFAAAPVSAVMSLQGCAGVAKEGVYRGDKTAFVSDSSAVASFNVIDAYLKFEETNRATISLDASKAADYLRANARKWRDSYFAVRDAYVDSPTPENRSAMDKALAVLVAGASQAKLYLK